jgi:hypothetical protein
MPRKKSDAQIGREVDQILARSAPLTPKEWEWLWVLADRSARHARRAGDSGAQAKYAELAERLDRKAESEVTADEWRDLAEICVREADLARRARAGSYEVWMSIAEKCRARGSA